MSAAPGPRWRLVLMHRARGAYYVVQTGRGAERVGITLGYVTDAQAQAVLTSIQGRGEDEARAIAERATDAGPPAVSEPHRQPTTEEVDLDLPPLHVSAARPSPTSKVWIATVRLGDVSATGEPTRSGREVAVANALRKLADSLMDAWATGETPSLGEVAERVRGAR